MPNPINLTLLSLLALLPILVGSSVYAATKHAVRALSEGMRQEVKPYNIRTTVISPGAVATELPKTTTDPEVAERLEQVSDQQYHR